MKLRLSTTRAVFSATALLAILSSGCAGGGHASPAPAPAGEPVVHAQDAAPRDLKSLVSLNSSRDLAAAQPESALGGASRDLGGSSSGPLTDASLADALRSMGLSPEVKDKGVCYLHIKATTSDGSEWTFPINVSLSNNGEYVWIICGLVEINHAGDPSAQMLARLMHVGFQTGRSSYVLNDSGVLVLQMYLDNDGHVSPDVLRSSLKYFFGSLKETEPLFKPMFGAGGGG